jgi:hypothetical protein
VLIKRCNVARNLHGYGLGRNSLCYSECELIRKSIMEIPKLYLCGSQLNRSLPRTAGCYMRHETTGQKKYREVLYAYKSTIVLQNRLSSYAPGGGSCRVATIAVGIPRAVLIGGPVKVELVRTLSFFLLLLHTNRKPW